MAAKEVAISYQIDVEATINRWIVDYYFSLALELFKNEKQAEFCGIRDLLNSVLVRPLESSDVMRTKIRVLQFLSRINDGENLDLSYEPDQSVTPLEAALMVLENMCEECNMPVPQQDFEKVCASLKEMMVGMFIKNNKFDKAKEVLNKHFPKPMVGKKAIFMALINRKSKTHEVIEQIDFHQFKKEMLTFCQSLCPLSVPFLHKAATQLIDKRLKEQGDMAALPDEQDEAQAGLSSSPQLNNIQFVLCNYTIIQRTRLEAAYKALAGSEEMTFAQLEEEVEVEDQARKEDISLYLSPSPKNGTNQDSEQDGQFQRDSGSPMEASPADQPPQTEAVPETQECSLSKMPSVLRVRHTNTVARLVVEPDSQGSSQCTAASQEVEADVRTEEPPQSPATPNIKDQQSLLTHKEVTIPLRKLPRCVIRKASKSAKLSSDSEEDLQKSWAPCKTPTKKRTEKSTSSLLSKDLDATSVTDSTLDSSPELFAHPVPQTSSTPQRDSSEDSGPSLSKWKRLYNAAKESKDTWSDEESHFPSKKNAVSHNESSASNSGHRKRKWSESETKKLKEGVQKFGEGNWSKIKAYYSFNDRTNVNLKDRWRTMKKTNMI